MSELYSISKEELQNWNDSKNELSQLEKFREHFKMPNALIQDVWKHYRLLPLNSEYLIASHHRYEHCGWSLMTKFQIVEEFDEALRSEKKLHKISLSIDSAIATQQKIIALQKLFTTLEDDCAGVVKKIQAFQIVKQESPGLYEEIIHKIGFVHGRLISQAEAEKIVRESHRVDFEDINRLFFLEEQKEVIGKMITLYKTGHPHIGDHFFTTIRK